ncbi:MAG: SagB/ThcOx family dehydrogenase [Planctomycetota bacterium]
MSVAQRYHDATKYAPETIADHPGLDWGARPPLFKGYCSDACIELGERLLITRCAETGGPVLAADRLDGRVGLGEISTALLHTYGITAMMKDGEEEHYFRAAPSAGALYPNELYLAVRDTPDLPDGLYHYRVLDHALVPVCEGDYWDDLEVRFFEHPAISRSRCVVILTGIFERSAWRYRERGYRRVLLDSGHVLGNLVRISEALEIDAQVLGGFDDDGLAQLLWLDPAREAPLCAVALLDRGQRRWPSVALASDAGPDAAWDFRSLHAAGKTAAARASRDCRDEDCGHGPSRPLPGGAREPEARTGPSPRPAKCGGIALIPDEPFDWKTRLSAAILLRRSARCFQRTPVPRDALATVLDAGFDALRDGGSRPGAESGLLDPAMLETWVAVQRVEGLDEGLYRYDPRERRLVVQRAGSHERACCHIALGQDVAIDAAFSVFMTARLGCVVERYGERGYRYLGLDAGHLGERLILAAVQAGVGATGIGGYFDDEVNRLFRLEPDRAVIYMVCFGAIPPEHRVSFD